LELAHKRKTQRSQEECWKARPWWPVRGYTLNGQEESSWLSRV
jgi:hypothetical protein